MDLILQCKNLNEEKIDETLSGLLFLWIGPTQQQGVWLIDTLYLQFVIIRDNQ